jgi:hypothetical protein
MQCLFFAVKFKFGSFNASRVKAAVLRVPFQGRAMAQTVSRRPHIAEARVEPGSVQGYVDKQAFTQVFLRVIRFFPVRIIPSFLFINILEMNSRPVGGRSSETSSHPIDMNNVKKFFSTDFHIR